MSLIRENLMTRPGYSPYCGTLEHCPAGMPRTKFDGQQFKCPCGWRSCGMENTQRVVRVIKHEESFEVRISTFFYFDENAGRRAITGRPDEEQAKAAAQEFARKEVK